MTIPFALPGCEVTATQQVNDTLVVDAHVTAITACCPDCGVCTPRIHSHYLRTPRDLPVSTQRVQLRLRVRRFFCDQLACARHTFAEQLPELLPPKAQRTSRLTATLHDIGAALGGSAGAALASRLRIRISPDTIVRVLRRHAQASVPTPRVLGVDDFALQKGRVYGTILVDIERGAPVDLLPDRKAETLTAWLQDHPGVEVITRDRSTEFTRGATDGAPDAVQVADRWHLLTNLREAVERMLQRRLPALKLLPALGPRDPPVSALTRLFQPRSSAQAQAARQVRREARAKQFQTVQELSAQGMNILQIADYLSISRQTVRRYRTASAVPEPAPPRPAPSQLLPYLAWLEQQWAAGERNGVALARALQAQGYRGGYRQVARWAQQQRAADGSLQAATRELRPAVQQHLAAKPASSKTRSELSSSSRQLAWLLVRDPKALEEDEESVLRRLLQDEELAQSYALAQQFQQMVRRRQVEQLNPWLERCQSEGASELQSFAAGLRQEGAAIRAALSLPYSNGPVEGQVTRLKLLKRQMYGRAKLDLLRLRVVHRR